VQCSTAVICHQHEPNADNGIASKTNASAEATSLNRHVMFLKVYYGSVPTWAVTKITAACNRDYEPAILGTAVFVYGGLVFIRGAWGELADRKPDMMTLISLAIISQGLRRPSGVT
jgi:cation transport ATPase